MNKTLIILASLFIGLGNIQSTEAQKLDNLKKKASKSVKNVTKTTSRLPKKSSKKVPTKTPRDKTTSSSPTQTKNASKKAPINATSHTRTTPRESSMPSNRTSNSRSGLATSGQASHVDTTRSRNSFWKNDIAQKLLGIAGEEVFKSSLSWNAAKTFTESYKEIEQIIKNGHRPSKSTDLAERIENISDPSDLDNRLSGANDKMGGPFSGTSLWKETETRLQEWKKVVEDWRDSPATHFNVEGVPMKSSKDYIISAEIDPESFENYFDLKINAKGVPKPIVLRFSTFMNINQKTYGGGDGQITALDDGYFELIVNEAHRAILGPEPNKAKEIEDSLKPLFSENILEGCKVCESHTGDLATIYFSTQEEPLKEKSLDFYKNDPPWDGVGTFYSRIVLTESLNNAISKTNPWANQRIKYRWYVKGEKEKALMDPISRSDIGKDNWDYLTWWQQIYDGINVQEVPTNIFEQAIYVLMEKGPGIYDMIVELVLWEGSSEAGWTETVLATGEKEINLSEANYKRLFVGPRQGIGAYRPPKYTGAASGAIMAAAKKNNSKTKTVKTVYMTTDNNWYWVTDHLGVKLYQKNDGAAVVYELKGEKLNGAFYSYATVKRDNGVYTVEEQPARHRTSKRNFTIK